MVKIVQNTDIPGIKTSEVFRLIQDVGYDGIDNLTYIKNFYVHPKRILRLSKKYHLPIVSLHQPKLLVPMHPKIAFKKMIDLINFFPDVRLSNYHLSGFVNIFKRKNTQAVNTFMQLARQHNIILTFESNPKVLTKLKIYPRETYHPDAFAEFCINHGLFMTFDTSHIADNEGDIVSFF